MTMSAEYGSKFWSLSLVMVMSSFEWKILEWNKKHKQNKRIFCFIIRPFEEMFNGFTYKDLFCINFILIQFHHYTCKLWNVFSDK